LINKSFNSLILLGLIFVQAFLFSLNISLTSFSIG
jgi:hypothetical protein